jgi:hypothetical protein
MFNPQLIHLKEVFTKPFSPEEIRVALKGTDNIITRNLRQDPFFLGPHTGTIRPSGLANARVEEGTPVGARKGFEGGDVVLDIEEAARLGSVDDLVEGVGLCVGDRVSVERDIFGGEVLVLWWVCEVLAAGFVANVVPFACGAGGGIV